MYYYLVGKTDVIGQIVMIPLKDEEMVKYDLHKSIAKTEEFPFIPWPEGSGSRTTRPRTWFQVTETFLGFLETLQVRASRHGTIKSASTLVKLQAIEIVETADTEVTVMDDKHYLRTLPQGVDYRMPDELVFQQIYLRTDGYQPYTVVSTVTTEAGRYDDDHLDDDRWFEMLDRY